MPVWLVGPLIKILLLAALVGGIFLSGAHWKQKQWDASIMEQSVKVAHVIVAVAQLTGKIATEHAATTIKTAARHEALRKDIRNVHPEAASVRISPTLERVFDGISGLSSRADGVPASLSHPASPPGAPEDGATLAEVLQAYEYVTGHYDALWDTYHALVEVIVKTTELQRTGSGN